MPDNPTVLILNGANLNMLGEREPDLYGEETLADIETACAMHAAGLGLDVACRQSNSEADLIEWVQGAKKEAVGLILNAGAYTHTSIALLDALRLCGLPVIEVHLSNVLARESYRHHSYVAMAARGLICGFGGHGYILALEAMARILQESGEAR